MTALGDRQRKATAPAPSRFAAAIAGKRVHLGIEVLGVPAKLTLVGHATVQEIESAVYKRMAELKIELSALTVSTYESERAVRTLAEAVRDADDPSKPLGTLEEWQAVDLDTIQLLWLRYLDLREEQDPISVPLTEDEMAAVRLGIEKKRPSYLRSCGARVLSTWLLTTADQPATSPQPSSTPSDSSSET